MKGLINIKRLYLKIRLKLDNLLSKRVTRIKRTPKNLARVRRKYYGYWKKRKVIIMLLKLINNAKHRFHEFQSKRREKRILRQFYKSYTHTMYDRDMLVSAGFFDEEEWFYKDYSTLPLIWTLMCPQLVQRFSLNLSKGVDYHYIQMLFKVLCSLVI